MKDELKKYIVYNEIVSNLTLSSLVFIVLTFVLMFVRGSLVIDLSVPFSGFVISLVTLSIIDYTKR